MNDGAADAADEHGGDDGDLRRVVARDDATPARRPRPAARRVTASSSLLRSTVSAITPAKGPKTRTGPSWAKISRPTNTGDPVRS